MSTFTIGQKVFAKIRGHPLWPGVVNGVLEKSHSKIFYSVYLYEINMNVELSANKLEDYQGHIQRSAKQLSSTLMLAKAIETSISEHRDEPEIKVIDDYRLCPQVVPLKTADENEFQRNIEYFAKISHISRDIFQSSNSDKADRYLEMQNLYTELILLACDSVIKSNLTLKKATVTPCLKALNKMLRLRLNEVILMKHPEIIVTVLKLRKYFGNPSKWKLNKIAMREFEESAKSIRRKANTLCLIFRKIFRVDAGCNISWTRIIPKLERNFESAQNIRGRKYL